MPSFTGISYRGRKGKAEGEKKKRRQHLVLQPVAHILQLLKLGHRAAAILSGLSAEQFSKQKEKQ